MKQCSSLLRIGWGAATSFVHFLHHRPRVIVGFGSYHAVPPLLAAWCLRIPIILFEANAIPGRVIRLFASRARVTAIHLEEAQDYLSGKTEPVLLPSKPRKVVSRREAQRAYHLDPNCLTLLIMGGSQGARSLNERVPPLLGSSWQVLHLAGPSANLEALKKKYEHRKVTASLLPFEPHMDRAWQAVDGAIVRGGASTVAELIQWKVPAVIVPYPYATDNHQLANSQIVARQGGGIIVTETGALGYRNPSSKLVWDQEATFDQALVKGLEYLLVNRKAMKEQLEKVSFSLCEKGSLVEVVAQFLKSREKDA